MTLDEILQDIHALGEDLQNFERKYGVLSETFYLAYTRGEEPDDEAWVLDWAAWAGTYEIYMHRLAQYRAAIESLRAESEIMIHNRIQMTRLLLQRTRIISTCLLTSSIIASPRRV